MSFDKSQMRMAHFNHLSQQLGHFTEIVVDKKTISYSSVKTISSDRIVFLLSVVDPFFENSIIKYSIIKSTIASLIRMNLFSKNFTIAFEGVNFSAALESLGLTKNVEEMLYELSIDHTQATLLFTAHRKLTESILGKNRPFYIEDGLLSSSEFEATQHEYNEIAWGHTNWARNSDAQLDELEFIKSEVLSGKNAEIGVGSGRLTEILLDRSDKLVGTDKVANIISSLNNRLKHPRLSLICDDITNTSLEDGSFDNVMFLENGLGATFEFEKRKKVFSNIYSILSIGGRFLLGVRSFGSVSLNQVMPATQDPNFIGIYRTFSENEIRSLCQDLFVIEKIVAGESRPAGGKQFFYVMRKIK